MRLTGLDGAGGAADGIEAGTAQPVDRRPGDGSGQASQQHSHACDIAVVLTRLVGAAEDAVVKRVPVDPGVARGEGADRVGGEVVRADVLQRAGVAADGGAGEVADIGLGHGYFSPLWMRGRPW